MDHKFSSEPEKKILSLIIQSKKQFYPYMRKNWNDPFFFTGLGTTGYQGEIRRLYGLNNPNMGMKLVLIGRYIHSVLYLNEAFWNFRSHTETLDFLVKVWEKYSERIEGKPIPKFPVKNRTQYIRELLERGFKAPEDLKLSDGEFILRDKYYGLTFHKTSLSKSFMKELHSKYGIENYTIIIDSYNA